MCKKTYVFWGSAFGCFLNINQLEMSEYGCMLTQIVTIRGNEFSFSWNIHVAGTNFLKCICK